MGVALLGGRLRGRGWWGQIWVDFGGFGEQLPS